MDKVGSQVFFGTLERGKEMLAGLLTDDGQPDPLKVDNSIASIVARSGKQRQLQASDAQKKAAQDASDALADQRAVGAGG